MYDYRTVGTVDSPYLGYEMSTPFGATGVNGTGYRQNDKDLLDLLDQAKLMVTKEKEN